MSSLYHSELKDRVPVKARIESGLIESKHKQGVYYVKLRIDGDLVNFTCENETIEDIFDKKQGQTVEIVKAWGSREKAGMEVDFIRDDRGSDRRSNDRGRERGREDRRSDNRSRDDRREDRGRRDEREPERRPAREPDPEPDREPEPPKMNRAEKEDAAIRAAWLHGQRVATMMENSLRIVVERLVPVYRELGFEPTMEDVRCIAHSHYMDIKGQFYVGDIPRKHPMNTGTGTAPSTEQQAPAPEQKKPEPPKEEPKKQPEPEVDLGEEDSIPF